MHLSVQSLDDLDRHLDVLRGSAARVRDWISAQTEDGMEFLRLVKFAQVGFHPVEDRPLNFIEQINQTWTYAVALAATRTLLALHPDAGGFNVAPGAHMSLPLDIMSVRPDFVGAETFAAVHPRNNRKLERDLAKMASRPEQHRYVFFYAPDFPGTERRTALERNEVQVWSIDV